MFEYIFIIILVVYFTWRMSNKKIIMEVILNITQENINKGIRKICRKCPTALALKQKGYHNILVRDDIILLDIDKTRYEYHLQTDISQWIKAFDNNRVVNPVTFTLEFNEVK